MRLTMSGLKNISLVLGAVFLVSFSWLNPLSAAAQIAKPSTFGDAAYQPKMGQVGKDVIWVPTSDAVAAMMLQAAAVTPDDLVYDLGAGDGKIAIAAARDFGARAVGIEYNPELTELARRNIERAGVADKVRMIHGDIFKENFSEASVVTLYLLPDLNLQLRPTLLKMKPGTRIVANSFNMGDWEPDRVLGSGEQDRAYFWVVPAYVAGTWKINGMEASRDATVEIVQHYQKVGGTLTLYGKKQTVLGAKLVGNHLSFSFLDHSDQLRVLDMTFDGQSMSGHVMENLPLYPVTANRN